MYTLKSFMQCLTFVRWLVCFHVLLSISNYVCKQSVGVLVCILTVIDPLNM